MGIFLIEKQRKWLKRHGRRDSDGWVCKKTNAPVNGKPFKYQTYSFSPGGPCLDHRTHPQDEGGHTYEVIALWCTGCGQEPMDRPAIAVPDDITEVYD